MKYLVLSLSLIVLSFTSASQAEKHSTSTKSVKTSKATTSTKKRGTSQSRKTRARMAPLPTPEPMHAGAPHRGWGYLTQRLLEAGVDSEVIKRIYSDKRLPWFNFVPFSIAPKEPQHWYSGFYSKENLRLASNFLAQHRKAFATAEERFGVNRYAIAALLLIETQYGKNTGDELIIYRLSRIASVADPENLERNFEEQLKKDPSVTRKQVVDRARYLEETFLPEIPALIELTQRRKVDIFNVRGSIAGAFGLPQFLPTSYLRFATDGDKDKQISLFDPDDAILSVACFLHYYGWKEPDLRASHEKVLWNYNKSDAYVNAVLGIADNLRKQPAPPARKKHAR